MAKSKKKTKKKKIEKKSKPKIEKKTKPKEKKVSKEDLLKEKTDIENTLSYLEDEYRKANISEKSYSELKSKNLKKLEEINKKLGIKKEAKKTEEKKVIEVPETRAERLARGETENEKPEEMVQQETEATETEEKKGRFGFLGKLFRRKKKEPEVAEQITEEEIKEEKPIQTEESTPERTQPEVKETTQPTRVQTIIQPVPVQQTGKYGMEIEKIKVMVDTLRETNRATEETIRTLSESLGELRSMVLQSDASSKEIEMKMEKIEDEISEIEPKKIAKKFREISDTIDKHQITLEKLDKKTQDLAEKINKIYEMLKSIGGIENLMHVNKDIQKKLDDIKEAVKYIERIGNKTEKIFIDLSKSLDELTIMKAKQEEFDESLKDLTKSIDDINVKFESYVSKKDLNEFRQDILLMGKQIEEINKALPIVQLKLPEEMMKLKNERNDILLFLDSLEEQLKEKRISREEYEKAKENNKKKLAEIEEKLKEEWKKLEKILPLKKEKEKVTKAKSVEVVEKKPEETAKTEEKGAAEEKKLEEKKEVAKEESKKVEEKQKKKVKERKAKKKIVKVIKKKIKKKKEERKKTKEKEIFAENEEVESERKKKLLEELKKIKV